MALVTGYAFHTASDDQVEIIAFDQEQERDVLVRVWGSTDTFEVAYTDLKDVWPHADVLDTFNIMQQTLGMDRSEQMLSVWTCPAWAALVRAKVVELY